MDQTRKINELYLGRKNVAEKKPDTISKSQVREIRHGLIFVGTSVALIAYLSSVMGISNFVSTIMETAYRLLMETALYILAIAVFMGSIGNLLSEFHVVWMLNKILSPLMRPIYNLPGAAFVGVTTTYLSDNPAIIALANDKHFLKHFKRQEVPCLCNLGTSFGMGLILTTFMMGLGFFREALIGNVGAIIGSVVSVRMMAHLIETSGYFSNFPVEKKIDTNMESSGFESTDSYFVRFMTSMLEGGKNGLKMGIAIIPGLIFVCTFIMILTFGPADPAIGYQGLAFEGTQLLPKLGSLFSPILTPLFGFTSAEAIAFPVTSLGAVGAALSLIPSFLERGLIGGNDIAVFTAMGMCWSGYLSTHVGMMDALGHRKLISSALISHTLGGLIAGISAHFIYLLIG